MNCFPGALVLTLSTLTSLLGFGGGGPAWGTNLLPSSPPDHGHGQNHQDHGDEDTKNGPRNGPGAWDNLILNIRADHQSTDLNQGHLVAEGNVQLQIAGGSLAAEHLSYDRKTGLLVARGSVRFQRGSQYIQASSFHYNLKGEEGELRDVYGLVNFDHTTTDFDFRILPVQPTSQPGAVDPGNQWIELPPMACPYLQPPGASPRPAESMVTRLGGNLPPPLGCPNPDGNSGHQDLDQLLDWVASGSGSPHGIAAQFQLPTEAPGAGEPMASGSQWSAPVDPDQGVHAITPKAGLGLEYYLRLRQDSLSNGTEEDPVVPPALRSLGGSDEALNRRRGGISRWRFQAKTLVITPEGWSSPLILLTNDPLNTAQIILIGRESKVQEQPDGSLMLTSGTNQVLLDGTLVVPLPSRIHLQQRIPWALIIDEENRDGLYVEHTLAPRSFLGGQLTLKPQLMLSRIFRNKTTAYAPIQGSPAADPDSQSLSVADLFGLNVRYERPVGERGQLMFNTNISSFALDRFPQSTRAEAELWQRLTLPLLGETRANLSAAYRFSVWNGSLGEQDVYTAFGGFLEKDYHLPALGSLENHLLWRMGLQNINSTVFDTIDLSGRTWRGSAYARLTSRLPIWKGEALKDTTEALSHGSGPIHPELSLKATSIVQALKYGDGSGQNTYTLGLESNLVMGHFSRPYLDYTRLSVGASVTVVDRLSRFAFDRLVDLGLLHISWTQQLIGPLLLSASMSYNVDGASENYGDPVDSLFELKWQQRAYGLGLFYSPERKLGGLRIQLNSFDWQGTGIPLAPYAPSSWMSNNQ